MNEFHERGHQLMRAGMMSVCGLDDGNVSLSDPESAVWPECLPLPEPGGWRLVGSLALVSSRAAHGPLSINGIIEA